ncbi:MBL fold metallo-hydrolase [Lederbergia sp. NSJ-179]|uniref:MBL fold metallo-hydrolase n=1 Tax=Lederbergia sp. NSJ-179 TaxID=2931402 RepID=UPI001FD09916|nr:MBL fold metallo-hydrolase [Lederbergia sp. NSJ-179]MCJ7843005.1 MBL fold metallo-hydrolase [Lederbergia sp. NSJ-179]
MKISVLGGGSEVGASCLHLQMGETNLLIDAGMRMHGDDLLPALGMLDGLGSPDCILVTHAHADHIGALPIVHSLFPSVPIYATPPTADLMRVMMKDAYKIMDQRAQVTNSLAPYTIEQVNALLDSLLLFPASGKLKVGNLTITSYRAGHILGAVMFLIEGESESVFVTGDLSFKAGRTIPGAQVPHDIHPDIMIMESTYGNRVHTDRHTEERRLADDVSEVIAGGGFALIPAFALGRAQEVLLVLQDYMDKGLIPEFSIYVDGLVTPISRIYKNYPHFLKGPVAHRIRQNGDAFLTEGRCKAVEPKEREAILKGKPGCIVASSGMLTGGASAWYAERLVSGEKNAIFITGYQDEESPGKKLLDLAAGLETTLEVNGTNYEVKCKVGKYGLSAHADANEMDRFVQTLKPTYTLLVHGDDEARSKLGELIDPRFKPILTENGETYPFEKRRSGKGLKGKRYQVNNKNRLLKEKIGHLLLYHADDGQTAKLAICTGFHPKTNVLICQTMKGKQVRLQLEQIADFAGPWSGPMDELVDAADEVFSFSRPFLEKLDWGILPEQGLTMEEICDRLQLVELKDRLAVALALQSFPPERKIKQEDGTVCYMLDQAIKKELEQFRLSIQAMKLNPAAAMERTRTLLAEHPRFVRCGMNHLGTKDEQLMIYFDFPDAIQAKEREDLATYLKEKTGWDIGFSDSVRQDLLQQLILHVFGPEVGTPSIHLHERNVSLPIEKADDLDQKISHFEETTGFQLMFRNGENIVRSSSGTNIFQVEDSGKKLNQTEVIEETKRWAKDRGITIYKVSVKDKLVEVHFISPEIAARHEVELEELSWRIGRPVTYAKNPKQNEIIRVTLESLPPDWQPKKNPSILMDRKKIAVKLADPPAEKETKEISDKIEKETGYLLEIIH